MAAGVPASSSFLIEESVQSKVLRDAGGMRRRSIDTSSTQTSVRGDAAAQSCITRVLAVVLSIIIWVWHGVKSLFSKAAPESRQVELYKELAHHVIAIKDTDLTIRERVKAFEDLVKASCDLLEPWSEQGVLAFQAQIQMGCNELPPGFKEELYEILLLSITEPLLIDSNEDINAIKEAIAFIIPDLPSVPLEAGPESSQETPASRQVRLEKELADHVIAIKDTDLTIRERVESFEDLLEDSYELLEPWSEQGVLAVQTQIQMGCDELPPGLKEELYKLLSRSMTEQLLIESDDDIYAMKEALSTIRKALPSVQLADLQCIYQNRFTDRGEVRVLDSMIQLKLSKLDPDVTEESLKVSVLNLFETFNESLKSEIYTEVQKVVLQETRSSNESDGYIDVAGTRVSVQDESLGKLVFDADPLGLRVQNGIKWWTS